MVAAAVDGFIAQLARLTKLDETLTAQRMQLKAGYKQTVNALCRMHSSSLAEAHAASERLAGELEKQRERSQHLEIECGAHRP